MEVCLFMESTSFYEFEILLKLWLVLIKAIFKGSCQSCTNKNCTRGQSCMSAQNYTKMLFHRDFFVQGDKVAQKHFCTKGHF